MLQGFYLTLGQGVLGIAESAPFVPAYDPTKNWMNVGGRGAGWTRALPGGAINAVGVVTRIYMNFMPSGNIHPTRLIMLMDSFASIVATLSVTPSGNLQVFNNVGTLLVQTTVPPIVNNTAHKIQAQFTMGAGTGVVEVRVDNVAVIGGSSSVPATALNMPGTIGIVGQRVGDSAFTDSGGFGTDFFVPYSLTGTYNNNFPSISRVATLVPTSAPIDTFTPRPYRRIGAGVMVSNHPGALDGGTSTGYDLGSGDYTLETWIRFSQLPNTTQACTIFGKWSDGTNARSYRLVKYGPGINNGQLRFEITTAGTLASLITIQAANWTPVIGRWYNLAMSRTAGLTRMFIDGIQQGNAVSDSNVYFAAGVNARFSAGGEFFGTGIDPIVGPVFNGRMDEIRVTVGVGRYTANFTPLNVIFPRNIGGDPSFASVQLLVGFDDLVVDESTTSPKTIAARGGAFREVPIDGTASVQVFNQIVPFDDRYMEAPFVAATNFLRMTGNANNAETVTIGSRTYTFNTTLGGANSILIGATFFDSLTNLTDAINLGPGIGTRYGTGTTVNTQVTAQLGPTSVEMTITAITAGTAGNSIATTETLVNGSWTSGATMTGGVNIPAAAEYTLSPLPPQATGLRALFIIDRAFVDADTASQQKSFVVGASVAAGANNSMTTTPTYRGDVVEQDPSTSAALTPTSVLNGRVRLNRTA
jgi:hypothetical protein